MKVRFPVRSEVLLPAQVPHLQLQVLVFDFLDIGANGGLGDNDFAEGELVKDGCLSAVLHAYDYDLDGSSLAPQAFPDFG